MRRPLQIATLAIIFLAALLMPVNAQAAAPVMTARFFYGTVTINGQPAPVGTVIEARGSNVRIGIQGNPLTTTQSGLFGVAGATGSKLIVQNDPDGGAISEGTQIDFYVNGFQAEPAYIWPTESAEPVIPLNLAVTIRLTTALAISSSLNPAYVGQAVTFTAVISGQTQYVYTPSGSIDFFDGSVLSGNVPISENQATYTTSSLSSGAHNIKAVYSGDNYFLSSQNSLTQTVGIRSGSGGGGTPITTTPASTTPASSTPVPTTTASPAPSVSIHPGLTVLDLLPIMDNKGRFLRDFEGRSPDGGARINILTGTVGTTRDGARLTQITIQQIANPGGAPAPNANFIVAGLCYDFEPIGAQFSQPVSLTLTYDPALVPAGETPYMAWWNAAGGRWEKLETLSFDPVNHAVTAGATHFTIFTVSADRKPVASLPAATTAAVTSAPAVTATAAVSSPPLSQAPVTSGRSNLGLIIGLIIVCLALIIIIIVLLKRKPPEDRSK